MLANAASDSVLSKFGDFSPPDTPELQSTLIMMAIFGTFGLIIYLGSHFIFEKKIEALQKEITELEKQLPQNSELQQKLKEAQSELSELRQSMEKSDETITSLQTQIDELKDANNTANKEVKAFKESKEFQAFQEIVGSGKFKAFFEGVEMRALGQPSVTPASTSTPASTLQTIITTSTTPDSNSTVLMPTSMGLYVHNS